MKNAYRNYVQVRRELKAFAVQRARMAEQMLPLMRSEEFNRNPKLIHLHIPKTAGKAFTALCKQNYPGATSIKTDGRYDAGEWTRARVIGGHFFYSCFAAAQQKHVFVGVVRDPVERALSRFRWYARRDKDRAQREQRGFDHSSLLNTLNNGAFRREFLYNVQCLSLTDCASFRAARKVLKSRPFIVGTFEQLDQWVEVIANEFGWDERHLPVVNRIDTAKPRSDNKPLLALLRKHNRADRRLYEYVRRQGVFTSLSQNFNRKALFP